MYSATPVVVCSTRHCGKERKAKLDWTKIWQLESLLESCVCAEIIGGLKH